MAWLPDLLGLAGFLLMLVQGAYDLRRRSGIEGIQAHIEEMRAHDPSEPDSGWTAALTVLREVKTQVERYRPWQGWLFVAGATLVALSYLWRLAAAA